MLSPVKIWRNQKNTARLLGKTGKVLTWTVVRVPPEGFSNEAPYPVVVVELTDKTRITAQMVDCDMRHIYSGQQVITVLRRIAEPDADGVIPYGIKVKPV